MPRLHLKILCLMILVAIPIAAETTSGNVMILLEQQVRSRTRLEVLPKYPRAAVKDKAHGVVVAMIEFDQKGLVAKVEIVQSNPHFAGPTIKALKLWRFDPIATPKGEALRGRGKLTFYCYYENGTGRCENPLIFKDGPRKL